MLPRRQDRNMRLLMITNSVSIQSTRTAALHANKLPCTHIVSADDRDITELLLLLQPMQPMPHHQ